MTQSLAVVLSPGIATGPGPIAFMAGELLDESGQVVAAATATAQIRAVRP